MPVRGVRFSLGVPFGEIAQLVEQRTEDSRVGSSILSFTAIFNIMNTCEYGCGQEARFRLKSGKLCCSDKYWKCPSFLSRVSNGVKDAHKNGKYDNCQYKAWNKGLTKDTDYRVKQNGEAISDGYKSGRIIPYWKGKTLPEEVCIKIQKAAIKAHKEGRAYNIGMSRWKNQPSYPESFFMKVIENEFFDKCYKREFPFHRFSLDFAWPHKKKCIEIDGQQHDICPGYKERDLKKDQLLISEGWNILRIKWIDMFNDTKRWILEANKFIDS